ncbi:MAG: helix-turn-helix domain-containing protein [Pseudonocardia sp.]
MAGRSLRELTPLVSGFHRLGAELRYRRVTRGLSQIELGFRIHHSGALVSKVEKAERRPGVEFCRLADEVLETGGVLTRLWRAAAPPPDPAPASTPDTAVVETDDIAEVSLRWADDVSGAIEVICRMWRSEMDRRSLLVSSAWASTGFVGPLHAWLAGWPDVIPSGRGGRLIGQAEVDALWTMGVSFSDADNLLGGAYARSTLVHYLDTAVRPLLLHGEYTDQIGREVMAAAARLCDICAFMCFDSDRHGLAQRYFVQALRLAQASGDRALAAHILGDMSVHAHHRGNADQALALATAGYEAGLRGGSPTDAARCAALQGRAHALRGDAAAVARSRLLAEQTLDVEASVVPVWNRFVTPVALTFQAQYAAADLGQFREVQRLAPAVIETIDGRQRRKVLSTAMLAHSYLPGGGAGTDADVDHACELLIDVLPALPSMTSARVHERVDKVRRGLIPYRDRASVRQFEGFYEHMLVTAAAGSS